MIDEYFEQNQHYEILKTVGPVGELPIHLCVLLEDDGNHDDMIRILKHMIVKEPTLLFAKYSNGLKESHYNGENLLHLAIIRQRFALVKLLLDEQAHYIQHYRPAEFAKDDLLKAQTNGMFFKVGKPCYYGEYPLAFSICTSQYKVAKLLLEAGADMNAKDSNGNNILHALVRNTYVATAHFLPLVNVSLILQ